MRDLLELEVQVLSTNNTLRNGFKIEQINALQDDCQAFDVSKFDHSLKLSKLVDKAFTYFKSDECKAELNESGLQWSAEDFFFKVFGYKKSQGYKLVKLARIDRRKINGFINKMKQHRANGVDTAQTSISVPNCLRYIKEQETGGAPEETAPTTANNIRFVVKVHNAYGVHTLKVKQDGTYQNKLSADEISQLAGVLQRITEDENNQ